MDTQFQVLFILHHYCPRSVILKQLWIGSMLAIVNTVAFLLRDEMDNPAFVATGVATKCIGQMSGLSL